MTQVSRQSLEALGWCLCVLRGQNKLLGWWAQVDGGSPHPQLGLQANEVPAPESEQEDRPQQPSGANFSLAEGE